MRKLTLDLEQLHVESFHPHGDANSRRGTVKGHSDAGCWPSDAPGCATEPGAASCGAASECCYATQTWCNNSQGGAQHTLCDMSCERACR